MMNSLNRRFVPLILLLACGSLYGDYLEVRREAVVKSEPDKSASPLRKVEPGINLSLLQEKQENGYYKVSVSEGDGWIYRTFVRRWPGEPPLGEDHPGSAAPFAAPSSAGSTTGVFHGCPPEGKGGDPILNRLKNRDRPPATFVDMTVSQFIEEIADEASEMGRKSRVKWKPEALSEVAKLESKGARIEGFLVKVKKEGEESCNCASPTDKDHHLWLAEEPEADPSEAMVVEISPRLLPAHPKWDVKHLNQVIKDGLKVRVSGWIMWDQEHPEQLGKHRGTLWEIHPIHQIEVLQGNNWVPLDNL